MGDDLKDIYVGKVVLTVQGQPILTNVLLSLTTYVHIMYDLHGSWNAGNVKKVFIHKSFVIFFFFVIRIFLEV